MLGSSPLLGTPSLSAILPDAIVDTFEDIAQARNVDFAIILEIEGFPKQGVPDPGIGAPLLGSTLLASHGIAGLDDLVMDVALRREFLSDFPYRTEPSDPLRPNLWTEARMLRVASVEESSIISLRSSRSSQTTIADLEFSDADGYLLDLIERYSFEERPAKIHIVKIGDPWAKRRTISEAITKKITRQPKRALGGQAAKVRLQDASNILENRPLSQRIYGGTGLRDGSPDLKGTAPPSGWGRNVLAKPLLEDPSIYLYRLHDLSINSVDVVEERGLALTFADDQPTYEQLRIREATLAEGEYATCLADGSLVIKWAGGAPVDPDAIRVTFEGDKSSGVYVSFWGDVMLAMLQYAMGVPTSQIDQTSFETLPDYKINYYFGGGTASPTGKDVFNEIMFAGFGSYGSVRGTALGATLFQDPNNVARSDEFTENEIYSVKIIDPPQEPVKSQEMGWGRNANPYTRDQLAIGSLTETQIEERTRDFAGVYRDVQPNIGIANLAADDGDLITSPFDAENAAIDSVSRIMGVWSLDVIAYELELTFVAADVSRGDVLKLTHKDLGSKSGAQFLVYRKRIKASKRRVILTVIGNRGVE